MFILTVGGAIHKWCDETEDDPTGMEKDMAIN